MTDTPTWCDTFWGSHGCDLPAGHDGNHLCGGVDSDDEPPHSEHTGTMVRSYCCEWDDTSEEWIDVGWSDWMPSTTFSLNAGSSEP